MVEQTSLPIASMPVANWSGGHIWPRPPVELDDVVVLVTAALSACPVEVLPLTVPEAPPAPPEPGTVLPSAQPSDSAAKGTKTSKRTIQSLRRTTVLG